MYTIGRSNTATSCNSHHECYCASEHQGNRCCVANKRPYSFGFHGKVHASPSIAKRLRGLQGELLVQHPRHIAFTHQSPHTKNGDRLDFLHPGTSEKYTRLSTKRSTLLSDSSDMAPKRRRARKRKSADARDANYTPESPSFKKTRTSPSYPVSNRIKLKRSTPAANKIPTTASNLASEPQAEETATKEPSPTTKLQQGVKDAKCHDKQTQTPSCFGALDDEDSLATHSPGKKANLKNESQKLLGMYLKLDSDEDFKDSCNTVMQEIVRLSYTVASLQVHPRPPNPGDSLFQSLLKQAVDTSSSNKALCNALLNNWLWRYMAEHCFDPEGGFWPGPISRDFQKYYRKLHKQYKEGNLDEQLFSEVKHTNSHVIEAMYTKQKDNLEDGNEYAGSDLQKRWLDLRGRMMAILQAFWQMEEEHRKEIRGRLKEIIRCSSQLGRTFIISKAIFDIGSLEPGFRPPAEDSASTSPKQYIVKAPKLSKRGNSEGDFSGQPTILLNRADFEF